MELLVLRLVFPPLTVLAVGWAQHRLGHTRSGQLVGLPLTSGPFLLVLLWAHGVSAATVAAQGVLAGQLLVTAFVIGYGRLTATRYRPLLAVTVVAIAVLALAALTRVWLNQASWTTGLVVIPVALLALACWPASPAAARPLVPLPALNVPGLAGRAALTGALVAALVASAPVLGASLAGVLAALPLVVAVVAPGTHAQVGGAAARDMLRGTLAVVPGTAAFAVVLALTLSLLTTAASFGLALVVMALINGLVAHADKFGRVASAGSQVDSVSRTT